MKLKRVLPAAVLLLIFLAKPADVPGCGPFFPEAIFTLKQHPQVSLDRYAGGQLGMLFPSYARKYLVAAYRHLSDRPLSPEEQEAFLGSRNSGMDYEPYQTPKLPGLEEWIEVRKSVAGTGDLGAIEIFSKVPGSEYQQFANCTESAFENAAATLRERIKTFGAGNDGIKEWVQAQDAVFSNCSSGRTIPTPAESGIPPLLAYDRQYQIAAAHFYAKEYDEAARLFQAIADTGGSPWREIAPYLAARSMIRKATVIPEYGEYDKAALAKADALLQAILKDETRRPVHDRTRRLSAFVSLRLRPAERLAELSASLQDPSQANDFKQNLTDYLYLLDRRHQFQNTGGTEAKDEITEWIGHFQSVEAGHSIAKWKETGKPAWLLAAISKMPADHPESGALMEAALNLKKEHPGFVTVRYHRIRLLMERSQPDRAREELDTLLPVLYAIFSPSSLNPFLEQRLALARNFDEFLKYTPRFPVVIADYEYPASALSKDTATLTDSYLDTDSVSVLNRGLPLSLLERAAYDKQLPENIRKDLIRVAWTRAVLLSDDTRAAAMAVDLQRFFPELAPDLEVWFNAKDETSRRFAAALLMLHFPGTTPFLQGNVPWREEPLRGIDNYRENWWCGFQKGGDPDHHTGIRYNLSRYPSGETEKTTSADLPVFLTEEEKNAFNREWDKLAGLETAPNYFGEVVLAWAKDHPRDPRVPEALHLAVKSSRVGCTDEDTGRYSREAFRLLHKKYPDSPWTEKTPYWYR